MLVSLHVIRAIHLRLTPGVEAGVTVVVVGSSGLANSEGAQHQGRGVTHLGVRLCWFFADAVGYLCATGVVVLSFNGGYDYVWLVNE